MFELFYLLNIEKEVTDVQKELIFVVVVEINQSIEQFV